MNKEAEEKLRIAARVFNQTGEAIIVTDPSGIIQTVNSAFTEVTGFSFSEAVGKGANILKSG
ncbi:PAS domain S-box protein [Magnetofaba australis]|uniref:PAS domain S-box protein n=1 Tax=Magnetofaba australis TaxID=1472297 RepID=UPI0023B9165F|nr:PAS domain S-box protein [Magnetofaba australis]